MTDVSSNRNNHTPHKKPLSLSVERALDDRRHNIIIIIRSNESLPDRGRDERRRHVGTRIVRVILRIPMAKLSCHLAKATCSSPTFV